MRCLLLFVLAIAMADDAEACSCVERSLAAHAKVEKRVFLARAGKPIAKGDALEQKFTVLATFKGPVTAEFSYSRAATPPCAANYTEGELAIIFSTDGEVDPCHGNIPLAAQAAHLADIVKASATATKGADAAAIEAGLRKVLTPYLHGRARIAIHHAPLAGKSFDIDKSKLVFEKTASKNSVTLDRAFTVGSIAFFSGRYKREGLRFHVLLLDDKTWTVIDSAAAET